MTLFLTLYLAIGYGRAVFGIARGKDPYWQVHGTDALRLIAQEMVIWGLVSALLLAADVLAPGDATDG